MIDVKRNNFHLKFVSKENDWFDDMRKSITKALGWTILLLKTKQVWFDSKKVFEL